MNISTKPSILKILEKLKTGDLDACTLPVPRRIFRHKQNLCVSKVETGVTVWGGTLLAGQPANQNRVREHDKLNLVYEQRKKVKVLLSEVKSVSYI